MKRISTFLLLVSLVAFSQGIGSAAPTISSFTASSNSIAAGQSASLNWNVSGATALNIDQGVGAVTGATVSVAPAATITYTLTATDADGSVTATVTVMVGPWPNYDIAYQSGLLNGWVSANWSGNQIHPLTNFAAAAPGRTGNAIEVSFGAFDAFGMWSSSGSKFINEFHTLEFDLYVEPDSTQLESLRFIFNDSGRADDHALVDFIPGWATMTDAQRYGHWFHVAVDLNHIHLINPDLVTFLLFNNSRGMPHFHLAEVKLGWAADTTPPVVTLDSATVNAASNQLTLAFSTDEFTLYRLEYGVNDYSNVIVGPTDGWSTSHSVTLNLTPGVTYQYRIAALDHRTNAVALPNQGYYTGTYSMPAVAAGLVPVITSFTITPAITTAGAAGSLNWVVSGATNLSLESVIGGLRRSIGTVTGTSLSITPVMNTTYILTASNADYFSSAVATVMVGPLPYESIIYQSGLQGDWTRSAWEDPNNPVFTDFAAAAPGRTGTALEVRFDTAHEFRAVGFDAGVDWFLNEFRTFEFDVYFEPDSTNLERIQCHFYGDGETETVNLVDLIPGWTGMNASQRYGQWFHVSVDMQQILLVSPSFQSFLFFYNSNSDGVAHYRLANVMMGRIDDTVAPVVTLNSATPNLTYDQLTLAFTTSENAIYRVEYGVSDYSNVMEGSASDWSYMHSAVLTGLTPGTTYQYRIVALDHHTDPAAAPNQGLYTSTFTLPPIPTVPPVISGLTVGGVQGYRASLTWNTDRPCTALLTYHKPGGADLTRTFTSFTSASVSLLDLLEPSLSYSVSVTVTDAFGLTATQTYAFTSGVANPPTVTISVTPGTTHAISPWIYGINYYDLFTGGLPNPPRNLTLNRAGGNRWTTYNWENNASNAGSDWYYQSDDSLGTTDTPAEGSRAWIATDRARNMATIMTVPLQGYVAADKNGPVSLTDPYHLANRFKQVVWRKGFPFTATPSTTDAFVYMDEFLWALRGKFSGDIYGDATTPTFISLDNEPELWPYTHAEVQQLPPRTVDYIQHTIALATALKDMAPDVQLFGPAVAGITGLANFQLDSSVNFSSDYWFVDKYLADVRAASEAYGHRLIDVFDFHWYSSATVGGVGIGGLTGSNLTPEQIQAIVQSPRSLWDPTYVEDSWIVGWLEGAPINILSRMQAKIDANWPGTKLSITEYENGGSGHIAGSIAQADNLGIFGSKGLFAANFWPASTYELTPFVAAAFKMYRDYDGQLGSFGDISMAAASSDTSKVATYVSQDSSHPNRYIMVAINRSTDSQDVNFAGLPVTGTVKAYRIEGTQTTPVFVGEVPVDLASWVITLPTLSVTTIELTAASALTHLETWRQQKFGISTNTGSAADTATPAHDGIQNLMKYALNLEPGVASSSGYSNSIVMDISTGFLRMTVTRNPSASDVSFTVEVSGDVSKPTDWTANGTTVDQNTSTTLQVHDNTPITGGLRRFMRLKVTHP